LLCGIADRDLGFDRTDFEFERPVTAQAGVTGQVCRRGDVSQRQAADVVDQVLPGLGLGEITTVDQNIAGFGERVGP